MSTPIFKEGQRVRIKPFDNGEELIPEEIGELCEDVFELSDAVTCCLYVDEVFRTDKHDDGLRELTTDQLLEAA